MIKKLKRKFVALSMVSLFVLLAVIVAGMNLINYTSVVRDADEVLTLLSQNRGVFPEFGGGGRENHMPPNMSPELPYESRYFSVLLRANGDVLHTETGRISAVDPSMAIAYANSVQKSGKARGFADRFRYMRTVEGDTVRITFLDCGRKLDAYFGFLLTSIGMALLGFGIVFFVIFFFAGKFIQPIAESYEKQKRFITDAGHEIKTPLTIIQANTDVLEMDIGQNECLEDIRGQAARLTRLTNDLIYLARMEENGQNLQKIDFPLSEVVEEAARPFSTLAQTQGKTFLCEVQPMLTLRGDQKAIEQLIYILMDNALKYAAPDSAISLTLKKQGKALVLRVCNAVEAAISPDGLQHIFDRFYRTDLSRNSETGGHGIGLSVANAIVRAHDGKIQAQMSDSHTFQMTVTLPI